MAKKKILFADDSEEQLSSMKRLLGAMGYEVNAVKNTDEEIEAARGGKGNERYELIISDINMDDKYGNSGGLHAIKEIREFDDDTPIILNSASLTDSNKKEAGRYKNVHVCSKLNTLAKIKEILGE